MNQPMGQEASMMGAEQEASMMGAEQEAPIENDQALSAAVDIVGQELYAGETAVKIGEAFKKAGTVTPKMVAAMAYKLAQKADTETGGEILEENLAYLGVVTLSEILEIAGASDIDVNPEFVSKAMKQLVLVFVSDQGMDASALEQQFNNIDDKDFAKFEGEVRSKTEGQQVEQEPMMEAAENGNG